MRVRGRGGDFGVGLRFCEGEGGGESCAGKDAAVGCWGVLGGHFEGKREKKICYEIQRDASVSGD